MSDMTHSHVKLQSHAGTSLSLGNLIALLVWHASGLIVMEKRDEKTGSVALEQ